MKLGGLIRQTVEADPARTRQIAEKILSDRKYQEVKPPNPFGRPIAWVGATVRRIFSAIADLADRIIPGNAGQAWGVIALFAALATVLFVIQLAIRQQQIRSTEAVMKAGSTSEDPAELEALALAAAKGANFGESVRLRFRAGLLRLQTTQRIVDPCHNTNGTIYESVRAEPLLYLQRQFDEIVYGNVEATANDEANAVRNWNDLLSSNDSSGRKQ